MAFFEQCKAELQCWIREALDELGLKADWDVLPWIAHVIETGYRRSGAGYSRMGWLKRVCGYKPPKTREDEDGKGAEDSTEQVDH
jgi:hypothetical protein